MLTTCQATFDRIGYQLPVVLAQPKSGVAAILLQHGVPSWSRQHGCRPV
jgi:hypothetical protein